MLRFAGGEYQVTADDRLWLLRAVQAEGPPQLRVAQALVNGFACERARRRFKGSLMEWVRAYAQPVNPRWFMAGDLYTKSIVGVAGGELVTRRKRAHERETMHSRRNEFTAAVVAAVNEALQTAFQSDVTDYAAASVDASAKGYLPRSTPKQGENRFWTRSAGWAGYVGSGWAAAGGGAGIALALLAVVWLLSRRV